MICLCGGETELKHHERLDVHTVRLVCKKCGKESNRITSVFGKDDAIALVESNWRAIIKAGETARS